MVTFNLSGATRLFIIVGDPIAQVRSPAGVTAAFAARGADAMLSPVQVSPADLPALLFVADKLKNLDGIVVTVPHKFSSHAHCKSFTERSGFVGSTNIMRRAKGGGWHGDMVDGFAFVQACKNHGLQPKGKRCLLVGAGGAGSSMALEFVDQGVAELAIHDADHQRRDALIGKLSGRHGCKVYAGSDDPTGFDIIANATPMGMKPGDPSPIQVARLHNGMFVGCVITKPAITPLIAAARDLGCMTATGNDMYDASESAMVDFLLAGERMA